MRAFFCLPIGERLRTDVASASDRLRRGTRMRASWVPAGNYHVTLRFLGEIDPMLTPDLRAACLDASEAIPPLVLPMERLGAFPSAERARVVWAGGDAPAEFLALAESLDRRLGKLGFDEERKTPVAHITIARVKGRADPLLPQVLGELNPLGFAPLFADRVVLMQSELTRSGARYTPLFTVALAAERSEQPGRVAG